MNRPVDAGQAAVAGKVLRLNAAGVVEECGDELACEEPLEIRVGGRGIAVTMRTPGSDIELGVGFLVTEGVLHRREDLLGAEHCGQADPASRENILNVFLSSPGTVDFERLTRHVYASSSCGICGKGSIEAVHQNFPPVESDIKIGAEILRSLPDKLRSFQSAFDRTGGLHAAGVFDRYGDAIVVREDVGRHNAVDKVIGFGFLNGRFPFAEHALVVSGRASFEIMQKAVAARIPVVAAISAPSSLAVAFARESGQTLVGFLRGASMNVYAGAERIG